MRAGPRLPGHGAPAPPCGDGGNHSPRGRKLGSLQAVRPFQRWGLEGLGESSGDCVRMCGLESK